MGNPYREKMDMARAELILSHEEVQQAILAFVKNNYDWMPAESPKQIGIRMTDETMARLEVDHTRLEKHPFQISARLIADPMPI